MYGDSAAIRKRVNQLREQAIDVRAMADELVARADALDWHGRAADTMRSRIRDRAQHLRDCATAHDSAADALDKHLTGVEAQKEAISNVEKRAAALIAEAKGRVAGIEAANAESDGVRRQADEADRLIAAFTPPSSGHRDWLTVELPGL